MSASESKIDVHKVANLARIRLSEEEASLFEEQIKKVLKHVDQIETLDLDGVEPTMYAVEQEGNVTRDDENIRESIGPEKTLLNSPKKIGDEFGVPKVVE